MIRPGMSVSAVRGARAMARFHTYEELRTLDNAGKIPSASCRTMEGTETGIVVSVPVRSTWAKAQDAGVLFAGDRAVIWLCPYDLDRTRDGA